MPEEDTKDTVLVSEKVFALVSLYSSTHIVIPSRSSRAQLRSHFQLSREYKCDEVLK